MMAIVDPTRTAFLLSLLLFFGILACLEIGHRIGRRRLEGAGEAARAGIGALEGAIFGLLGLLIAFTFSGAVSRFDSRRHLIVQEANIIGTAYLRVDVLPNAAQPALRENFRRYVDSRLAAYQKLPDIAAMRAELARANGILTELWTQAVRACRLPDSHSSACMLLLPAMNETIDIATTQTMVAQIHPPGTVFAMLFALALATALLAGYGLAGGASRNWLHMVGFSAILALTFYVILDLEYPRLGLIRIDAIDQALIDVRAGMK